MINIIELSLNRNRLTTLPRNIFSSLTNLNDLNIGFNSLTTVHSESFGVLPKFATIYFSNNNVNAFDERIIDNIALTLMRGAINPCIQSNNDVFDDSENKVLIRAFLKRCFDNFEGRNSTATTSDSNVPEQHICAT